MKTKLVTGLVLSSLVAGSLYANSDMNMYKMKKNDQDCKMMKKGKKGMHMKRMMHKPSNPVVSTFRELNLTKEQKQQIKEKMSKLQKPQKGLNEAFTKSSFDKAKYMELMKEKRENMLKSQADRVEIMYSVLTPKQKEQLKVLLDLKKEKMEEMRQNRMERKKEK